MENKIKVGIIDYQAGKPSASKVFESEKCKVMEMALSKGDDIKTHSSPVDALLVILEGNIIFQIEGEDVVLVKFDAYKIPAIVPHSLHAQEDSRMLLIK
ncbi:MAG: cupin domain-containing protein [Bacteroidetes bacterium]|nr:cupin domain-containing protein [Bacteroidota bacterium]